MKGDGGPAFPTPYETRDGGTFSTCYEGGMTLRDYFAAKAMHAIASTPDGFTVTGAAEIALMSYRLADEMLRERTK